MTDTKKSPFFTSEEAANFLRIAPRTLKNWRWAGKGPKYRKHGQLVVYLHDDLMEFSKVLNNASQTQNF